METNNENYANSMLNTNKSIPIVITIKNITDEKIYDVDLFNLDKNPKLAFATKYKDGTTYDDVVNVMNTRITKFSKVLQFAYCEFKKFQWKQLNCNLVIKEFHKEIKDNYCVNTRLFMLNAYQQNDSMCELCLNEGETITYHENTKFILDFLMPETEIALYFYPMTIETVKENLTLYAQPLDENSLSKEQLIELVK